ncbi:arginyltransferase [Campylobacter corcagiensis]|uniref:Aspartate/glutamate leucyltransferase n=1 Tax=Campylobacter corcagiensis TaxID=1448857 RepID=A0A7M1LGT3_9BACT|nr:arginyltransferase [Campylobacter corcagiensis]QOQ87234.1 arginyltransferase [Campylobacter corcagiensis]
MNSVIPFCTLDTKCPYLGDRNSRTEYIYIKGCLPEINNSLVKRGFRRFGRYFQKPICEGCGECISVRIDAFNFKLSKSQRRVIRKNSNTKIYISRPLADDSHVELFRKYHKYMNIKREWKYYDIDLIKYYDLYIAGYESFGKEISYYVDEKLVCVDLVDIIDDGISSIYCYYDPDYSHLSLGKFSLLKEIGFAKEMGLRWIYLGYYVKGCQSLEYKKDFLPQESLVEYVDLDKSPVWVNFKA